jgi:hypothetical protein
MEHATLQSELAAFHAEYLARVGVIDVQLQELEARLAEGTPEAERVQRRHRETTTAMASVPVASPPPTDDLKTLFRDAAKRIHPDLQLHGAGREHAEAFMKQLNAAYGKRDAEAIANLVRQWETSPYAVAAPGAGPAPALVAAVEQAEQRLAEARRSDLARLLDQALLAQMHGRDLLQELRWQAEEALAAARLRAAALDG